MKKMFTVCLLLAAMTCHAQENQVRVGEPGMLRQALEEQGLMGAEHLTVTGTLNAADIRTLRLLCGGHDEVFQAEQCKETLKTLNLENADIVTGGGNYYYDMMRETSPYHYYTSDNEVTWYMFAYTTSLEEVTLPKTVTAVRSSAFIHSHVKRVIVSEGTTFISEYAFHDCPELTFVGLPATTQSVSSGLFQDCDILAQVDCLSTTPPTVEMATDAQQADLSHCRLMVPAGTRDLYASASFWKDFGSIEENDAAGIAGTKAQAGTCKVYDMAGRRSDCCSKGLKIIQRADGTVVKSLVK